MNSLSSIPLSCATETVIFALGPYVAGDEKDEARMMMMKWKRRRRRKKKGSIRSKNNDNNDNGDALLIHSFILFIWRLFQVHYYSEALPTQHGYCVGVSC